MLLRPHICAPSLGHRGRKSVVTIEQVTLERCLQNLQTPFFATSLTAVEERVAIYRQTLARRFASSVVHYAVKANFALPLLRAVVAAGAGLDIVSEGEWRAALAAGCDPKKICFAGVGKARQEIEETVRGDLGYLNVEHVDELVFVLDLLVRTGKKTCVSVRLNPCLEIETHPHLKTGALDSKFGILFEDIVSFLQEKKLCLGDQQFAAWVQPLQGVHVHVGSQLQSSEISGLVINKVVQLIEKVLSLGVQMRHFDLGGGLGVSSGGVPSDASDIVRHVELFTDNLHNSLSKLVQKSPCAAKFLGESLQHVTVALEPGRSVVASSTVMFCSVLYTKTNRNFALPVGAMPSDTEQGGTKQGSIEQGDAHRFVYVDAGMNDFPRPALYSAKHHVELVATCDEQPVTFLEAGVSKFKVVGPVCESGDVLATDAALPNVNAGDILCFFEAGAYCRSMASHYNLRPLPGEIFIKGTEIVDVIQPKHHI